jgi:hypothetical protein
MFNVRFVSKKDGDWKGDALGGEGRTPFGELFYAYMKRAGFERQKQFVDAMSRDNYPYGLSQQSLSKLLLGRTLRVYPEIFRHAKNVLGLSDEEEWRLIWAWVYASSEQAREDDEAWRLVRQWIYDSGHKEGGSTPG